MTPTEGFQVLVREMREVLGYGLGDVRFDRAIELYARMIAFGAKHGGRFMVDSPDDALREADTLYEAAPERYQAAACVVLLGERRKAAQERRAKASAS